MRFPHLACTAPACAALIVAALAAGSPPAGAAPGTVDRATYLRLAEQGLADVNRIWWNPVSKWYTAHPYRRTWGRGGLATLWDAVGVFEATSLIAIADPRPETLAAARRIAIGAERYWNRTEKGYNILPDMGARAWNLFFDDTGWWGLAFFEAYRATHDRRFLRDAARAYRFIVTAGWAADDGGGVWWDTAHEKKTAEPLAAAALLGALLYETTRDRTYLRGAQRLIAWADAHSWNGARMLYQRNEEQDTVMNYVEGMMVGAQAVLCRALHKASWCSRAEALATAAVRAFPPSYHWAPETDAIYLRWMLALWATDHNPKWYRVADHWGRMAVAHARDARGLFTRRWDGTFASNDRLLTPSGTLMLLAALAASPAP